MLSWKFNPAKLCIPIDMYTEQLFFICFYACTLAQSNFKGHEVSLQCICIQWDLHRKFYRSLKVDCIVHTIRQIGHTNSTRVCGSATVIEPLFDFLSLPLVSWCAIAIYYWRMSSCHECNAECHHPPWFYAIGVWSCLPCHESMGAQLHCFRGFMQIDTYFPV